VGLGNRRTYQESSHPYRELPSLMLKNKNLDISIIWFKGLSTFTMEFTQQTLCFVWICTICIRNPVWEACGRVAHHWSWSFWVQTVFATGFLKTLPALSENGYPNLFRAGEGEGGEEEEWHPTPTTATSKSWLSSSHFPHGDWLCEWP